MLNRRVTFVIPSLSAGGAERVMASMCNFWVEKGCQVSLVTLAPDRPDHYALVDAVHRVHVDFYWRSANILVGLRDEYVRLGRLREAIVSTQADVVVSFMDKTNVRVLMSLVGTGLPVVVSERCDPTMLPLDRAWTLLRKLTYPRAAAVVVQTASVAQWMVEHVSPQQVATIPNAVVPANLPEPQDRQPMVVAMGRLTPQKGFDLLLRSWAAIPRCGDWTLTIMGDGEQRAELEQLCLDLSIADSVRFLGVVDHPHEVLARAQLFVLSSRYEGFPNALLEAMASGLPVISFDCPSGPADIIRDGVDGYLVAPQDTQALADKMFELISNRDIRQSFARRAPEVVQRFSQDEVMAQWEVLLEKVTT